MDDGRLTLRSTIRGPRSSTVYSPSSTLVHGSRLVLPEPQYELDLTFRVSALAGDRRGGQSVVRQRVNFVISGIGVYHLHYGLQLTARPIFVRTPARLRCVFSTS